MVSDENSICVPSHQLGRVSNSWKEGRSSRIL